MHLRSSRVFVQTATTPLVRPASVTMSQKLRLVRTQGNCQSETFHSPMPHGQTKKKEKKNQGVAGPRSRPTDPPRDAKSHTQLTNISMGITVMLGNLLQIFFVRVITHIQES